MTRYLLILLLPIIFYACNSKENKFFLDYHFKMSPDEFHTATNTLLDQGKIKESNQVNTFVHYIYSFDCPNGNKMYVRYLPEFSHKELVSLKLDFGRYGNGEQFVFNDSFQNEENQTNILAVLEIYKTKYGTPQKEELNNITKYKWIKNNYTIEFCLGTSIQLQSSPSLSQGYIKYDLNDAEKEKININSAKKTANDI